MTSITDALSVAGFRAWLLAQPPEAVVGEAGSPLACPLSCYLAACGEPWAYVGRERVDRYAHDGGPRFTRLADLPAGLSRCVARIDVAFTGSITAAEALRALDGVAA